MKAMTIKDGRMRESTKKPFPGHTHYLKDHQILAIRRMWVQDIPAKEIARVLDKDPHSISNFAKSDPACVAFKRTRGGGP